MNVTALNRLRNSRSGYGLVNIILHWLVALAVIVMYPLGLFIDTLNYYDPLYNAVPTWHKCIGILLAFILTLRLLWRMNDAQPSALASHARIERLSARIVHALLYLLLIVVIVSGYLISTADGRPLEFCGWISVPALPFAIKRQEDIAGVFHYWLATTLVVIAVLHAVAALKHHVIDRDNTLKRMVFIYKEETS